MIKANVHEAKTQLSRLIERAEAGEEVVIARNGTAVVRLQPIAEHVPSRRNILGALRGQVWMASDADLAKADQEIEALFDGGGGAADPAPVRGTP